ncbi:MAG TPA: hypothetical protein VFV83_02790 [Chthoniobacteraceae bacterium]|nr:hypothetical protein [Chthoniobacteraceae bacterium]
MNRRAVLVLAAGVLFLGLVAAGVREGGRKLRERKERQVEGLRQLDAARNDIVGALRHSVESGEVLEDPTKHLQEYDARLTSATEHLSADDRKPVIAGQRVLAQLTPLLQVYTRELKTLQEQGFSAPASLSSREAIRERSESVSRFDKANADLLTFYGGVEEAYRAELKKERLSELVQTQAIAGFRAGANIPLNISIRKADAELARLMQRTLDILDRNWGRWRVAEDDEVLFDEAEALAQFSAVQSELEQTAEHQRLAQAELLEATSKAQMTRRVPPKNR